MGNHRQTTHHTESHVFTTSIRLLSAALERQSQVLAEAQETIERLTQETEQRMRRNGALQGELVDLRKQLAALEGEREQWIQEPAQPRHIRPLPLRQGNPLFSKGERHQPL